MCFWPLYVNCAKACIAIRLLAAIIYKSLAAGLKASKTQMKTTSQLLYIIYTKLKNFIKRNMVMTLVELRYN